MPQARVPSQPAGVFALSDALALLLRAAALAVLLGRLLLLDALGAVLVELLVLGDDFVLAVLGLAAAAGAAWSEVQSVYVCAEIWMARVVGESEEQQQQQQRVGRTVKGVGYEVRKGGARGERKCKKKLTSTRRLSCARPTCRPQTTSGGTCPGTCASSTRWQTRRRRCRGTSRRSSSCRPSWSGTAPTRG